ncbi:sphingomyelin phosphodiesterase [Streptomyces sp. NPDC005574]|uniref:sphingomyelin phosphodiesterase n=1 Tax=Streptomyces sp. NPDC005574 TaxID=3156891 RepID=UPI0033B64880
MRTRSSLPAVVATFLAAAAVFGTTATAEATSLSTATAAPPLNIVSSNTMLLPSIVVDQWAQDFRGGLIGTSGYVQNHDVIVFQELFDNSASGILQSKMKAQYPYQTPVIGRSTSGWDSTQGNYSFFTPEDGGAAVLSRWPITNKTQFIYDESCGSDSFSGKGFAYVRLNVNGTPVNVIGTHLQSDDDGCNTGEAAKVRLAQLKEIRTFVDRLKIPASEAIVYAGDMNIDRHGPEYPTLLSTLNASTPAFTGVPYTMDPVSNSLAKARYTGEPRQWLDYILFNASHAHPATWTNSGLNVHPSPWTLNSTQYRDYSDHYPIQGS